MPGGAAAAATSAARVRRNNGDNHHHGHKNATRPTLISPRFVAAVPTTLVFKEKRTGDSKNVRDASGDVVFEVDPRHLTLSKRRILRDKKGVDAGHFRHSHTKPHTKWYIGALGDDKRGYVLHRGPGAPDPDNIHADIFIPPQFNLGGMEDHHVGVVQGDWRSRECHINLFQKAAARVARGGAADGADDAADSYQVEVAAGADAAFVTMVVLALNEIYGMDDGERDEEAKRDTMLQIGGYT